MDFHQEISVISFCSSITDKINKLLHEILSEHQNWQVDPRKRSKACNSVVRLMSPDHSQRTTYQQRAVRILMFPPSILANDRSIMLHVSAGGTCCATSSVPWHGTWRSILVHFFPFAAVCIILGNRVSLYAPGFCIRPDTSASASPPVIEEVSLGQFA